MELAATSHLHFHFSLRLLKRFGRFSKVGLEVSLSPSNLHLSLYFSRLNQRFSLSLLLSTGPTTSTAKLKLLFWTTVLPFSALALWELHLLRQRQRLTKARAAKTVTATKRRAEKLQAHIARRRAEADKLTVIMAAGVEPRQSVEQQRRGAGYRQCQIWGAGCAAGGGGGCDDCCGGAGGCQGRVGDSEGCGEEQAAWVLGSSAVESEGEGIDGQVPMAGEGDGGGGRGRRELRLP
ncbi:hypothetical protein VTI74DRAFT_10275 [Chaetomium olivicolor]